MYVFEFIGGAPCLDFCNTVSNWRSGDREDRLPSYAELVRWAQSGGFVAAAQARTLLAEAERHPREAERVLADARVLRESIYRIFSAIADGERPARADLAALNQRLGRAYGNLELAPGEGCCELRFCDQPALDRMLWPVVRSAAELLTSNAQSVRVCASDSCAWIFLDTSKNHSRRWCTMKDCGNRAKARRHYARSKGDRISGSK